MAVASRTVTLDIGCAGCGHPTSHLTGATEFDTSAGGVRVADRATVTLQCAGCGRTVVFRDLEMREDPDPPAPAASVVDLRTWVGDGLAVKPLGHVPPAA